MAGHRRAGRLTAAWDRVPPSYRAALFFLSLAALAGLVTAFDLERTRVLDREGRRATATVVSVDRWVRGGPQAEVRFRTDDGRQVVTTLQEFAWAPTPGRRVTVEYAPRDPYYYVRDPDAAGADVRFYGRVTAACALLAVLIPVLRRPVLWLRARAEARPHLPAPPPRPRYRVFVDADGNARRERLPG